MGEASLGKKVDDAVWEKEVTPLLPITHVEFRFDPRFLILKDYKEPSKLRKFVDKVRRFMIREFLNPISLIFWILAFYLIWRCR